LTTCSVAAEAVALNDKFGSPSTGPIWDGRRNFLHSAGFDLAVVARIRQSLLTRRMTGVRHNLNSGAVKLMMDGYPMHLHPNGLAVASYPQNRQQRSNTGGSS
jgi:hypothetical protein